MDSAKQADHTIRESVRASGGAAVSGLSNRATVTPNLWKVLTLLDGFEA